MFFFLVRIVAAISILLTPITAHCYTNGRVRENSGCQCKCHCEGDEACDRDTGVCQGKCDPQWFGPACQYASLNFTLSEQLAWLTDNDDGTCNDQSRPVQSITVRLDTPQRLSWVRVMVNERDHLRQFQLTYRTESSRGFSSCPGGQSAKVNDLTLDISCPTIKVIGELKLSGPGVTALCSLYITDGRNVALGQSTDQSDTYDNWYSLNAVDGDPGVPDSISFEFEKTCTHTPLYRADGWWKVTLSNSAAVFKIVIYNRRMPSIADRLIGFTLEAFTQTSTRVFTYTDLNPTAQQIYTVIVPAYITDPINTIKISKSDASPTLTLCEVLIFGETACPSGKFGLECEQVCNCADRQESCFVSTGGCPSGCAAGYTGEDCYTPCPEGSYGVDCNRTCSKNCIGNGNDCTADNGHCTGGCEAGYIPPLCADQISAAQSKDGGDDTAVIGAVVGTIVGVIIVTVIFIFFDWRGKILNKFMTIFYNSSFSKRHRRKRSEDNQNMEQSWTKNSNRGISAKTTSPASTLRPVAEAKAAIYEGEMPDRIYSEILPDSTAIAVENLRTYLHNHASDNFLKNQFEVKGSMYWPGEEGEEIAFGEIKVKLLTTKVFAEYIIREMQLSKKAKSPRALIHFHFTAWPEKSVPDSPWGLVDFQQRVLASPGSGPLLVHCSNGVGRTGMFIALCHLLQEAETTGKMDFLSTLKRLRQDRMNMIQTIDQYKFLHYAALVGHMAAGTSIPVREISERFKRLENHQNNGFRKEFDALSTVCVDGISESTQTPDDKADGCEEIQTVINKQKNRFSNILPKFDQDPPRYLDAATPSLYSNGFLGTGHAIQRTPGRGVPGRFLVH
ncbi:receptor-type tyrosine-protein phosphatase u [Plakobranchus ocellatus]|uniref:protein-tyrosine-phosphatase n=1 Tax=Plakobranchus ocellatus TaxID=259542 RepID=A0AAV3YZC4_9GAST|nr:receptor-type tyrosine-protein phosphatase u [Plakobranchus ocellatus]